MDGLVAVAPCGMDSDCESDPERTLKLSLPATTLAPPLSVQAACPLSNAPPGTGVYWELSSHFANGCDICSLAQLCAVFTRMPAFAAGAPIAAAAITVAG